MKKCTILPLMFALIAVGIVLAQEAAKAEEPDLAKAAKYLSLAKTKSGENLLAISYPWRVHEKASIEVRLVTDPKDYSARVRPLRFAQIRFPEEVQRRILKTFDESLERPSDWTTQGDGRKWQIIGKSNHFGRQAEWFVNLPVKDGPIVGTTAVFFPPDAWAVNHRLLQLDLPRAQFEEPGKLYVWFLRGDKILWQEELMWPGQQ